MMSTVKKRFARVDHFPLSIDTYRVPTIALAQLGRSTKIPSKLLTVNEGGGLMDEKEI